MFTQDKMVIYCIIISAVTAKETLMAIGELLLQSIQQTPLPLNMGMQYPQRCTDPSIRYNNFTHNNNTDWDMTFYYNLEELGGNCPENSSDFPICSCNEGYQGNLVFDENTLSWLGSCTESDANADGSVDGQSNNTSESNSTTPIDEENEVPGFGFITVSISLLAISFFRRRK